MILLPQLCLLCHDRDYHNLLLCCICSLYVVFVCCAVFVTGHLAVDQTVNKHYYYYCYILFFDLVSNQ